jgi:hypothetical protein
VPAGSDPNRAKVFDALANNNGITRKRDTKIVEGSPYPLHLGAPRDVQGTSLVSPERSLIEHRRLTGLVVARRQLEIRS